MSAMPELLRLVLAVAAGFALGVFFFAGLWWTVRRCLTSKRPALWLLSSLLLRTAVLLAGFYWIAGDSWRRLLACALGFVVARLVVTWSLLPQSAASQPSAATQPSPGSQTEGAHAP